MNSFRIKQDRKKRLYKDAKIELLPFQHFKILPQWNCLQQQATTFWAVLKFSGCHYAILTSLGSVLFSFIRPKLKMKMPKPFFRTTKGCFFVICFIQLRLSVKRVLCCCLPSGSSPQTHQFKSPLSKNICFLIAI